jgi:uncharacterized protein
VPPAPAQPQDVVRDVYDAFARRDVDAVLALVDPAFEFWPQGTSELARRGGPYVGPDGLREYFADVEAVWEELRLEPGELRVAGNGVVAFGTVTGRAGGRPFHTGAIWVWKLRDGRVLSCRAVATAAEALAVAAAD